MNEETESESFLPGEQLPVEINYLWLIVEGVVKSYTINQDGKTIILGFWGKQEVIGKPLSRVSPYFIQCINQVKAIAIPQDQWGTVSINLLDRTRQIQEISYIVRNTHHERLLMFLQWLAQKFGDNTPEGTRISFPLTKQELADALGMDKILVISILHHLEQENWIAQLDDQHILLKK